LGYLLTVPVDQRASAFFRMWTCKEAFLKATGQGLIDHMAGIQVRLHSGLDPELQLSPLVACDHRNWLVRSIPLPQGYVGTLVAEKMVSSAAIQTCRSGTIREIEYK
jgi:4'-phosphopantetheinyl transferase